MGENDIAKIIVDTAFQIHKRVGPGLLESAYETILEHELNKRGLKVLRQLKLALSYDELEIPDAYRIDLLVEDLVIVEVKSVEAAHPVHKKQVLTYLKLSNKRLGLLINFSELLIKNGIHRIANGMPT